MASPEAEKEKMRRWVQTWKSAGEELDRIKTNELQALTEEQAARHFDALTWPAASLWLSPERLNSEGLIEQQRWFQRARKH